MEIGKNEGATLEGLFDEAEILANFGLQIRSPR